MKAAFLTGIRRIDVRDIPAPKLQRPEDVLLRVVSAGVCGSDLHYYRTGRIGDQVVKFPWRVGHEFGAVVEAAGPQATGVKIGQTVAVDPLVACGKCDQCRSGRSHTCRRQFFMGCPGEIEGCLAEYVVMPAHCCLPVPAGLDAMDAALAEPFSICLHAVRQGGLDKAAGALRVGVLGAGPIGLGVLAAVRAAGEHKTYATDILDERVAAAKSLGADWAANAKSHDIVGEISQAEPLGLDVVFECAGQAETADQATALLAPGGTLVLVGIPEADRIALRMNHMRRKELTVRNVRRQNECVGAALEMMASRRVDLRPLVTHRFPLERTAEAFEIVCDYRDGVIKAMIDVGAA